MTVIETALDDLSPQLLAHVTEAALAKGALDVMLTPVIMKKGPSGDAADRTVQRGRQAPLETLILSETSTLGVRIRQDRRVCLDRAHTTVRTEYGPIRIKTGSLAGRGAERRARVRRLPGCGAGAQSAREAGPAGRDRGYGDGGRLKAPMKPSSSSPSSPKSNAARSRPRTRQRLKTLPFEDLGHTRVDHHRSLRMGLPEVIYAAGKTPQQTVAIFASLVASGVDVLATRVDAPPRRPCWRSIPPRPTTRPRAPFAAAGSERMQGHIAVVCAGSSDLPVAEEAAVTAETFHARVTRLYDVGVAGIHRLLAVRANWRRRRGHRLRGHGGRAAVGGGGDGGRAGDRGADVGGLWRVVRRHDRAAGDA